MTDSYQMFIYYGSRQAQPAWVRRFIDLAVERLENSSDYVLSRDELAAAAANQPLQPDSDYFWNVSKGRTQGVLGIMSNGKGEGNQAAIR